MPQKHPEQNLEMVKQDLICEDCGELFTNFTRKPTEKRVKRFCDKCLRNHQKAQQRKKWGERKR